MRIVLKDKISCKFVSCFPASPILLGWEWETARLINKEEEKMMKKKKKEKERKKEETRGKKSIRNARPDGC